jgi:DNA mismatch repair protein MutS2
MAVLDYLIKKNARMIITTHHGILKHYGYTRAGVENASVEFDARTLSPTYRIINGLPGESRALDIAAANGLNNAIVADARKYIEGEKSDVSQMIKELEQKQRELAGQEKKSAIEQSKLKENIRKADLKELQLRQKEAELKRESVGKLREFLSDSRKKMENLVRELKEGEVDREKTLKVREFLNELGSFAEKESKLLAEEERNIRMLIQNNESSGGIAGTLGVTLGGADSAGKTAFAPGLEVFAGISKQRGTIIRAAKKSSGAGDGDSELSWLVKVGSLKINFPQSELIPVVPARSKGGTKDGAIKPVQAVSWAAEYGAQGNAVYELKVIGMRLDEATETLRRQIEAAMLAGLKNFAVIHGKGTGILQKGVHDYLKKDPAVADYYFARPELGGFGRTEVVLK